VIVAAMVAGAAACSGNGADRPARPSSTTGTGRSPASVAATDTPTPSTTMPPLPSLTAPPQEFVRGNENRPAATLTFDCGASAVPTPTIIDVLRREGVRTTFFLTGAWAEQNPDLAWQIASEHELANHTYSHSDLRRMSDAQVRTEMEHAESAIFAATGRHTKPLWRAPFGSRAARELQLVADAGWPYHIFWTADALDWQPISPDQVRANMNRGAVNGGIILAHCGSPQTAAVLPQVIADFRAKGLTLTTVTDVLRE
jgi:peptidoglycan/xylan/chitin deacetylase (PgdA/CDA1 family)